MSLLNGTKPFIAILLVSWINAHAQKSSNPFDGLFEDPVVAKGRGFEITRSLVDERFFLYQANLAARGHQLDADQRGAIERQLIDKLVTHRVLALEANEQDKAKAKDSASQMLEDAVQKAGSKSSYQRQLIAVGMNDEQFKAHLMENALSEAVIERVLLPKVSVSEEMIESHYEKNLAQFTNEERARLSFLMFSFKDEQGRPLTDAELEDKRQHAKKILARIRRGADFLEMKREYNEDKSLAGGQDIIVASRQQLYPSLSAAVFSLKPGGVSDLVEAAAGLYIIKLHEIIPQELQPLEEVRDSIRQNLIHSELQTLMPEYIDNLKQKAGVQVMVP